MADAPEIPEAADPFEKRVALSIAVMAVVLSVVSMKGDNAKGDALLAATEMSNQWAFYQARSIKEHTYKLQRNNLAVLQPAVVNEEQRAKLITEYDAKLTEYKEEPDNKEAIRAHAEQLDKEVKTNKAINDRCDQGGLLLQIAIVLCSVAILIHWAALWFVGDILAIAGAIIGGSAFFM